MATKSITDKSRDVIVPQPQAAPEGLSVPNKSSNPTPCILVVGMAGAGKTTFVQRLTAHLHSKAAPPYVINLDPAVHRVPYPVNIDIRDTVNYKEVMKQYGLGPNGGIMTSLNLFSTQFDQVLQYIEKRANEHSLVIIDTPGQLEVFTWSASLVPSSQTHSVSRYPRLWYSYWTLLEVCHSMLTCSILSRRLCPSFWSDDKRVRSGLVTWTQSGTSFMSNLQSMRLRNTSVGDVSLVRV